MKLSEITLFINGTLIGVDAVINGISIDTRTLKSGQLYIAIVGKNFDGHDFVTLAKNAGAVAILTDRKLAIELPQIIVKDTQIALAELAGAWRKKWNAKVIGITGSNGKTTTKEMLAVILGLKDAVLFTKGNLNNEIGVPLTLLRLSPNHRYAVIEMGANHAGEIAYTSRYTQADVSIITNVGAAHLEGFGDINGVAQAKSEIIETLMDDGIVILNSDDVFFDYWKRIAHSRKIITFGLNEHADVRAENIEVKIENDQFITQFTLKTTENEIKIWLPLAGHHNVLNALAAAAAALAINIPLEQIAQGLSTVSPVKGRLQLLRGYSGNRIINDTYNANLASLKAALETLKSCKGEHWVILGAFAELGEQAEKLHFEMGEMLKDYGVECLFTVGELTQKTVAAFGEKAQYFASQSQLIATLKPLLTGHEIILIKGSRSQHMENITTALVELTGF